MLGDVGLSSGVQSRSDPRVDSDSSAAHLQFFAMTLEFSVSPRAIRRLIAETLGAKSRSESWKWAARQVRDYRQDPNWKHAALIGKIGAPSTKVPPQAGRCRRPLYVALPTSINLSDLRDFGCMLRMKHNNWDLIPTCDTQPGSDTNLRGLPGLAARNVNRARRRRQRAQTSPISEEVGPLT